MRSTRTHLRRDMFYTFDIETTTLITGFEDRPIREGIIWSGQFYDGKDYTQVRSLKEVIRKLQLIEEENKDQAYKVACFVHNLSYEFQFIKDFFNFEKILCTDERKIISAETDQIVFRCSYRLSNMNLSHFLKNENVPEEFQKSEMDYNIQRFPWTELSPEEEKYCANDVIGLHIAIENRIKHEYNADINNLPLTSTGYVRRDCRKAVQEYSSNKYRFYREKLDYETYTMLKTAFRGGNTHANKEKANKVNEHVGQKDVRSEYPAMLLFYNYPTKFYDLNPYTEKEFNFYFNNPDRFALIIEVMFKNLRLKNMDSTPVPYISTSKCDSVIFAKNPSLPEVDNGRLLSCDYASMIITEIDYKIILDQYEFDEQKIVRVKYSTKKPIMEPIRNKIIEYYTNKSSLKQDENSPEFDAEKAYLYARSKELLNGIYGMHVTSPVKEEYIFTEEHEVKPVEEDPAELLEKFYHTYSNFLSYQTGVWCTAYARAFLQRAIDLLINKEDPSKSDLIYCDTDSIKYVNPESHEEDLKALNDEIISLAEKRKAYIDYNGKRLHLGIFEDEGIVDFFKTFGAKKYIYGSNDNFKITISGVPKKLGKEQIASDVNRGLLQSPFDIKKGYVFHGIKNTSEYRDHELDGLLEHEIEGHKVYYGSNIAMYPASYSLGLTYDYELLLDRYKDIMED